MCGLLHNKMVNIMTFKLLIHTMQKDTNEKVTFPIPMVGKKDKSRIDKFVSNWAHTMRRYNVIEWEIE